MTCARVRWSGRGRNDYGGGCKLVPVMTTWTLIASLIYHGKDPRQATSWEIAAWPGARRKGERTGRGRGRGGRRERDGRKEVEC